MKKLLIVLLTVLLSLSLFISCDNSNKTPDTPPVTENKPETPPATEETPETPPVTEKSEIVILDFSAVSSISSRGLSTFPEDNPFMKIDKYDATPEGIQDYTNYGFWMACNVMRSLPIFPGLRSAGTDGQSVADSMVNTEFTALGFSGKVSKAEKTDDGIYIIYDLLGEDGTVNGRIEYYYSSVEQRFSYREIVAPLFGSFGAGDQVFVFELLNVPVVKSDDGYAFKAGNLYDNGSAFRHVSFINGENNPGNVKNEVEGMLVEDSEILMNFNNNAITAMEYKNYKTNKLIPLTTITGDKIKKFDLTNRKTALDLTAQVEFLKTVFEEKTFAFSGYDTIEAFNSSSLEYQEGRFEAFDGYWIYKDKVYNGIGFPLSYDLNRNIGACFYMSNSEIHENNFYSNNTQSIHSFTSFVEERFKECFNVGSIRSFDEFAKLMFVNLGLEDYANSQEKRKSLLEDSYNN